MDGSVQVGAAGSRGIGEGERGDQRKCERGHQVYFSGVSVAGQIPWRMYRCEPMTNLIGVASTRMWGSPLGNELFADAQRTFSGTAVVNGLTG